MIHLGVDVLITVSSHHGCHHGRVHTKCLLNCADNLFVLCRSRVGRHIFCIHFSDPLSGQLSSGSTTFGGSEGIKYHLCVQRKKTSIVKQSES